MTFQLDHMCSTIHNMDRTIAFYQTTLDAQVVGTWQDPDTNAKHAFVQIADGLMHFTEPATHDDSVVYGLSHIGFTTDDLDAAVAHLTSLGYVFCQAPKATGFGNDRSACFVGVNDVHVKLLQREQDIHVAHIPSDFVAAFDHYALNTISSAAANELFHGHLQMGNVARFVYEGVRELQFLDTPAAVLEIVCLYARIDPTDPSKLRPEVPTHSHIALRVADIHRTYDHFAQNGYVFEENAIIEPALKVGGLTMNVLDPDGMRIEIMDRDDLRNLAKNGYTTQTHDHLFEF